MQLSNQIKNRFFTEIKKRYGYLIEFPGAKPWGAVCFLRVPVYQAE